ncbi:MAG: M20 family metallopeptidase [Phycisphaerales bacterium]
MSADAPSVERIRSLVAEELPRLVALRRDLHRHPEVGYEEVRTAGVIVRELAEAGVAHVGGLAGGTGVLAHVPGPGDRAVALRADIDALPILESSGRPYASATPGRMHACGHDGHTAIMVGTARVLARLASHRPLPRPVTLVFQPAEEGGAGGRRMVEDGALDGSRLGCPVAEIHALHGWPELELGHVATRDGAMMAASDRFEIAIDGQGAHAAWPHRSADPIVCAAARCARRPTAAPSPWPPLEAAVVSVTVIEAGSAFNVIPNRAVLKGTLRSLSEETRCLIERRVERIAHGIAEAHGCRATCDLQRGYPVTVNHPAAVSRFRSVAREALGDARVHDMAAPVMGGEDFAFYGAHVPSCYWTLGLAPGGAPYPPLHAPDFDFNDDAIATGVELMCCLAVR